MTWGDLLAIVRKSPRKSALYTAMHPGESEWGMTEQLLAAAVDALNAANWQRGEGKQRDYPKPIPRPGVEPDEQHFGGEPVPMDEMAEWLGWSIN